MDFSKMHSAVGLSVMNCNRETSRCYWENIGRKFCARNCEFLINFPKHLKLLEKMKCINVRDSLRLFPPQFNESLIKAEGEEFLYQVHV